VAPPRPVCDPIARMGLLFGYALLETVSPGAKSKRHRTEEIVQGEAKSTAESTM
jgi:hypothetical protein